VDKPYGAQSYREEDTRCVGDGLDPNDQLSSGDQSSNMTTIYTEDGKTA
jgi:hypothetical protein